MPFQWKKYQDKFKGEGIYFLTFVVAERRPLLGTIKPLRNQQETDVQRHLIKDGVNGRNTNTVDPLLRQLALEDKLRDTGHLAWNELSPFGRAVADQLQHIGSYQKGVTLCAKQIMPNHIHVILQISAEAERSVRQIGQGIRIGITRLAREQGIWPASLSPASLASASVSTQGSLHEPSQLPSQPPSPGHILDIPFIRTLSHKGQLRSMIDYTHSNPDNAWIRHCHPDLYVIHRDVVVEGLRFDMMGKSRLLSYPDTQVIALSRSLTQPMIDDEVKKAKKKAARGVVTYCGVMNKAEQTVTMAVRHAGHPLVVMLLDGFPPDGTEQARFYHPGGIYHRICGEGKLLLLDPDPSNYQDPRVIALTEEELRRKAELKHMTYTPIPHTTKRWRMIANNVMLKMIAGKGTN